MKQIAFITKPFCLRFCNGLCDGFMRRLANWLRSENINAVSRRQDSDSWTGSGTGSLQLSYRELQVLDSYYQPSSMAMTQLSPTGNLGSGSSRWRQHQI